MSKVYEFVKENLLKKLEEAIENGGNFEWIKPWNGYALPMSYSTKKVYRGINLITLSRGGYYLTMNEIKKNGGKLRKGSKAESIYFWTFKEVEDSNNEGDEDTTLKETCIFKYYRVFHQSDVEGIDFPKTERVPLGEQNKIAENIINSYKELVEIEEKEFNNRACYSQMEDKIYVPKREEFKSMEFYYGTVFHEMVHSTGHETRLNRLKKASFGSETYSKEELVAEIGSSLLSAYCGMSNETTLKNNVAYLKNWYENIKKADGKELAFAGQKAQKAVDFILKQVEENVTDKIA